MDSEALQIWADGQPIEANLSNAVIYLMGAQARRIRDDLERAERSNDRARAKLLIREAFAVSEWLNKITEALEE